MKKINLCILLLDLVGSTKFVQKYGNEHAAKIFQAHDKLTRSLIYKFSGSRNTTKKPPARALNGTPVISLETTRMRESLLGTLKLRLL